MNQLVDERIKPQLQNQFTSIPDYSNQRHQSGNASNFNQKMLIPGICDSLGLVQARQMTEFVLLVASVDILLETVPNSEIRISLVER